MIYSLGYTSRGCHAHVSSSVIYRDHGTVVDASGIPQGSVRLQYEDFSIWNDVAYRSALASYIVEILVVQPISGHGSRDALNPKLHALTTRN